jgi:hypothetical protein
VASLCGGGGYATSVPLRNKNRSHPAASLILPLTQEPLVPASVVRKIGSDPSLRFEKFPRGVTRPGNGSRGA